MSDSRGFSILEVVVALLLGLFVVQLGLATLARLRTLQLDLAARADALVAMRVARHVLRRELRDGRYGTDWWVDADSIGLRAFRGTGLVCSVDDARAEITVAYRGDRRADPAKDSVLTVDDRGDLQPRALVGVTPATVTCPMATWGEVVEKWQLDAPADSAATVVRLFERGSYHLAGAALRYRRGASGRQPLTPEVWSSATRWRLQNGHLVVDVAPRDSATSEPWSAFLAWAPGA